MSLSLNKQERLRRTLQFKELYNRGRRLSGPHLTLFYKPNQLNFNRLGVSVAKKRFKLSAHRHYFQRRLREAFRLNKLRLLAGYDIVLCARGSTLCSFSAISKEFLQLAQRARLLKGLC